VPGRRDLDIKSVGRGGVNVDSLRGSYDRREEVLLVLCAERAWPFVELGKRGMSVRVTSRGFE